MKSLVLAIDFDGTIATKRWPDIGEPIPGAVQAIRQFVRSGHKVIISTCRSGKAASDALAWLKQNNVPYHEFNENLPDIIKRYGGDTRKISADLYIDDKNIFARHIPKVQYWPMVIIEVNRMAKGQ